MQKDLIYLSRDEYKQFLNLFNTLKKQLRTVQILKEETLDTISNNDFNNTELKELERTESMLILQINQKCEELPRIRFRDEANSEEEKIIDKGNTVEDETIKDNYANVLFFKFEDNPNYEKKSVGKALFILNGISSYFGNINRNIRTRKVRVR